MTDKQYSWFNKFWLPFWLLSSTFVIAVLLAFFPTFKWLLYLKDISIALFLVSNFYWIKEMKRITMYVLAVMVVITATYFFTSPAPLLAKGAALRQMLMPFLVFIVGVNFGETKYDLDKLKNWICTASIVLCAIGILFYLTYFWDHFSIFNYTSAKNLIASPNGSSYMFYEPIGAMGIPRLVSTILDPINLGHLLVFTLVIAFTEKRLGYPAMAMIAMSLFATFSKGAFLQLFITVLFLLSAKIPKKILIIIWLLGLRGFLFALQHHGGVLIHMRGLFIAIKNASLFGYGLGMVGNQAVLYGTNVEEGLGDTFIGAVLGQIGIIGLILWLIPFVLFYIKLKNRNTLRYLLIAQLVVAVLSENSFNLLSILFLMMTIGATINADSSYEKTSVGYN